MFGLGRPSRPEPIYSFFPIYSPFKLDDNDGFDLGADNCIKSIYIQDQALRFELSAVLRPGRFLGNHYLAFTIPNRTFIITLDRVKEGIRAARKTKRAARALREAAQRNERWRANKRRKLRKAAAAAAAATSQPPSKLAEDLSSVRSLRGNAATPSPPSSSRLKAPAAPPRSFFSRFVDGYLQAERDGAALVDDVVDAATSERVTAAIRDFFGRQGRASNSSTDSTDN